MLRFIVKILAFAFILFGLVPMLRAQNVGIGTTTPQARLHVVGGVRADGWLATTPPVSFPANNAIDIATSVSSATVSPVGGVQANVITYSATAYEGQFLNIFNGDGDPATFAGTSLQPNQAGGFVYLAGGWRALGSSPSAWLLAGNAGTTPASQFLGTTDLQDLVFRTNNLERVRITSAGNVGVGTATPITQFHVFGSVPATFAGKINTTDNANVRALIDLKVQGRYAYGVANNHQLFNVFDVSNPGTPVLVSTLNTGAGTGPYVLRIAGQYAYVGHASGNRVQVIDISNPANPSIAASVATPAGVTNLDLQGRYLYVPCNGNLFTYDIGNPTAPLLTSTIALANIGQVQAQGRYLYALVGNTPTQLRVFDLSNPAIPTVASTVNSAVAGASGGPSLWVQGRHVYIAHPAQSRLEVFNVSNPTAPVSLTNLAITGSGAYRLQAAGRFLYVSSNTNNVYMRIDISNPAAPVALTPISTLSLFSTLPFPNCKPAGFEVKGRFLYGAFADFWGPSTQGAFGVYDLGGGYLQHEEAGTFEADNATINNDLTVMDHADLRGGATVNGSLQARGNLNIFGQMRLVDGNQAAGRVLTSDANGVATWQASAGGGFWTQSGNLLYPNNTVWNVGIGNTVPSEKLEVTGNIELTRGASRVIRVEAEPAGGSGSALTIHAGDALAFALNTGGNLTLRAGDAFYDGGSVLIRGGDVSDDDGGTVTIRGGYGTTAPQNGYVLLATDGTVIGRVGIGTVGPTELLSVNGNANKPGGGTWAVFSDERLKKNIEPYSDGLAALMKLRPVTFQYNGLGGIETQDTYVGLVAQEVQQVLPYTVAHRQLPQGEGKIDVLQFDPNALTYLSINAIKELAQQNAELKRQVEELKRMLENR